MLHDRESEKICSSTDSKGQLITSSILGFMSFSTLGNNIAHGLWPLCWDVCCHKGPLVKTEKTCNAVGGLCKFQSMAPETQGGIAFSVCMILTANLWDLNHLGVCHRRYLQKQ